MRARLEVGHDCKVDRLVMNTTPPTFRRIMLFDICTGELLKHYRCVQRLFFWDKNISNNFNLTNTKMINIITQSI